MVVVALAGFAAAFVDGALGMGFGPTSSSILLGSGLSPATASAAVNIAKVFSGIAGGVAHWKAGNVDRRLVWRLAVPGVVGAAVGTTILASVDGDVLRPILAALLFVIGVRILVRFRGPITARARTGEGAADGVPGVEAAAAVGGVTNGLIGAWGPVVTPYLVHHGVAPRFVVGSVNTAEIAVATVAAGSLLTSARHGLEFSTVAAMLIGGVLAAPVAAHTVRRIPARLLGVAVAGLLLLTNARELARWGGLGAWSWAVYLAIVGLIAAVAAAPRRAGPEPALAATPAATCAD